MKFSDIFGHKEAIAKLRAMADSGRIPHAILLHGPSGIGKMQLARAFVQYVNCTDPRDGDSCGKCAACLQTAKLNNPDVHYVYPIVKKSKPPRTISADAVEEWKEFIEAYPFMPPEQWAKALDAGNSRPMIYVTECEEILRLSSLSSYGNRYKIFVVWLPEKMNQESANKLLKVIEEPFSDTLFVMVSNDPDELLPTVRSRLQGVELKPLSPSESAQYFLSEGYSPEEALAMAKITKGDVNLVATINDDSGELHEFCNVFIDAMRGAYSRRLDDLKKLADRCATFGREKSLRLADYFSRMVRESFISNTGQPSLLAMTPKETEFVKKFGPFIHAANVETISSEIDRAANDISRNGNQKIVWFDFFLELCRQIRLNNKC